MPKFFFCHESPAWFGAEWSLSEHGLGLPGSVLNVGCRGSGGVSKFGGESLFLRLGSGLPSSVANGGRRDSGWGRGVWWQMLLFKARVGTALFSGPWRLLAVGVLEWGGEFGAEWWFTRAFTVRRS